jgi:ATP-dependent Clp protease ATP-binding subunit ClpB
MEQVKGYFRPEFINRLDEIIFFKPLGRDTVRSIIGLLLQDLNNRLADREISVELTDDAVSYLINTGYDPLYGARPLRRLLEKSVETLAARIILGGNINAGDKIVVSTENGQLAGHVQTG